MNEHPSIGEFLLEKHHCNTTNSFTVFAVFSETQRNRTSVYAVFAVVYNICSIFCD